MSEPKRAYFSKIREAREALKGKSLEIFEVQLKIIKAALEAQDFETAAKANQWLLEHLPKEEGLSVLDSSIDKAAPVQAQKAIPIQIGIALGGMPLPQAPTQVLPEAQVVDVEVKDE